jgi:heterodisulfide reductase subunit C/nitrate reductase gamma subunit
MTKQIVFLISLLITLGVFAYTTKRLIAFFKLTRPAPVDHKRERFKIMMKVAFGQSKILRKPVIGMMHALVFWGFLIILLGSVEMVIDGLFRLERSLRFLGPFYNILTAFGDIFALIILLAVSAFLFRRIFMHIRRFSGIEMQHWSHVDANIALGLILFLMISLLGMNTFYFLDTAKSGHVVYGSFPVSGVLSGWFTDLPLKKLHVLYEVSWWSHILTIFVFANYLPYSKHFHVFLSVPGAFLSKTTPLAKMPLMENVLKEVKLMLDPETVLENDGEADAGRFGVLDVEDVNWMNYFDSLSCTQCGRCTSVCPANMTGKKLSPRKLMMDVRARMNEKGPEMLKNGKDYSDNKSLLRDMITEEEIWACTLCNACARECPINIDQPSLIIQMRRYLVMEEAAAPAELNNIFSNIENNGAPWQFSQDDRMQWADNIYMNFPGE